MKKNSLLPLLIAALIACFTYIVFSPSLKCGFVGRWDDQEYVTASPLVIANHIQYKEIFQNTVSHNYHPLTILTLAFNYRSGKLNPAVYHLWNVWLHVFNTLLVFVFIYLLTKRNLLMAAIVSLFFGIHPMHVESVTWISERKDVLYVFFFLAGLITYLKYIEQRKIIWYAFTIILFILSCLSKGMAVVFPLILMLIDYLLETPAKPIPFRKRKSFINKIPLLIIALCFGIAAYKIQQNGKIMAGMEIYSVFERIMFSSYGLIMYVIKFIIPFNLSTFYPYPAYDSAHNYPGIFYLAPFVILGFLILIYFFFRKNKQIVFGLLFFIISISIVLQFISVGNAVMADRYSYLSYIGLLFIIAYIVDLSFQKSSKPAIVKYLLITVLIIGAAYFIKQTYAQTKVWNNTETLWTNAIKIDPKRCYLGYFNRGTDYEDNKQYDLALADFNNLIQLDPTKALVFLYRGIAFSNLGKDSSALQDFNTSINLDPSSAEPYYDRGRILANFGKDTLALQDYNKAIELNPEYALAFMNRGVIYYNHHQPDSAIKDYNKALEINPSLDIAYYNRGIIYYSNNKFDLALADFSKAIALNGNVIQYWQYSSLTNKALGKTAEAEADDIKVKQMTNPGN